MVSVPLIGERVKEARTRAAVTQFASTLRAARMIAVTTGQPVPVVVRQNACPACSDESPANSYDYIDASGRPRLFRLPSGVRITASTSPIEFKPNGSLDFPAETTIEAGAPQDLDVWTVSIPLSGIPALARVH
jgi:Tfp pilus assembly protein FimT